ncbi:MAG: pyridoxamine 5'-phosphate oxidase family protein [Clostridia bacterium]|nr:pyridoxamine 5'-phosphate oxidase family protein [Clostridia bacterium]
MRRKDRQIEDKNEIESILQKADVCRIAMCDGNIPYIVPMNYGYSDGCIYLHCAKEGRKLDVIAANNNVCFEVDIDHELVVPQDASHCTMKYRSVIGRGKAFIVESAQEKVKALNLLMEHYTGRSGYEFPEKMLDVTGVIKIQIEEMTGKKLGY